MTLTLAEKSARITCVACSIATTKVRIVSFDPFEVEPKNVLDTTFAAQHITGTQVDVFKKAVADLIPSNQRGRKDVQSKVLAQAIDSKKKIMRFSNFLEGCLAEQEVG